MANVPAMTNEEKLKLRSLSTEFRSNDHEIAVLDAQGLAAMWYGAKLRDGASMQAAQGELHGKLNEWGLEDSWNGVKDWASIAAGYTATAQDVLLLNKLAQDLAKGGSVLTKYRVSMHKGKAYVIFKGNHKAREILTGTRYLANNTKIVSMGVGKLGAAKAIAGGVKLTIILMIGFLAIDTLRREEECHAQRRELLVERLVERSRRERDPAADALFPVVVQRVTHDR